MRACILMLLLCILAPHSYAQEFSAGFVQGVWYSQESVFAGDTVRIYVAIRNNTGSDLSGTVEFFDGTRKIERKSVQALDGRIIESWADWTPTYGSHTVSANLSRIELNRVGTSTKEVEVTSALAEDTLFVDYDTDTDGIGNETDSDDDGDSISDVQEKKDGTDPLVKNSVPDEDDSSDTAEDEDDEGSAPNKKQGLERYLADSPAENVFTSVTEIINTAKEDLDTYRQTREEEQEKQSTTTSETYTDGFGEATHATSASSSGLRELSLSDFFASVWNLAKTLFNWVYTFVLFLLSFILGHPILVQVGVLLLILFFMIKAAAKFGRRPKNIR